MAATTAAAIRDRISTVVTALTPTLLSSDRFRESRNEYAANFREWVLGSPAGAFRRFQVRDIGEDTPADSSNTTEELRAATYEVVIAYPQTHRYGDQAALDRDDVMSADQHQIETAIGMRGTSNFTSSNPNAAWVSGSTAREVGDGVDFLVITQTMRFWRTM